MGKKAKEIILIIFVIITCFVLLPLFVGPEVAGKAMAIFLIFLMFAVPIFFILLVAWEVYKFSFFRTKFTFIKQRIQTYIYNCNELNKHIESLKDTQLGINRTDYGEAISYDNNPQSVNRGKYKNPKYAPNIYNCSKEVCSKAKDRPFEYVCKYFGIKKMKNH